DDYLYFATSQSGAGRIMRIPLAGGTPVEFAVGGTPLFAGGRVFFSRGYAVGAKASDGGADQTIVSDAGGATEVFAATDRDVFFGRLTPSGLAGVAEWVPAAGGDATSIADTFVDGERISGVDAQSLFVLGVTGIVRISLSDHSVLKLAPRGTPTS